MAQSKLQPPPELFERIQQLTLYDDRFMSVALGHSILCIERVLRIIYNDESISIVQVYPQKHVINLERRDAKGHHIIQDIFALDTEGRQYNLEIQVKPNDNLLWRARYYGSITDTEQLREGMDYRLLPELYIAFVTQTDYFEQKCPLYAFESRCEILPKTINTGVHITFVNGACVDDSPLGKLMHDMACADPDKMCYKELRERCAFLKRTPQGRQIMAGIWAEAFEQGIEQGIELGEHNIVMRLICESGLSDDDIMQYTGVSRETIEKMRQTAANDSPTSGS